MGLKNVVRIVSEMYTFASCKLLLQVPPVLGLTQAGAPGCDDDLYADYGGGSNDDCVVFVAADSVATSAVAIQTNDGKQKQD